MNKSLEDKLKQVDKLVEQKKYQDGLKITKEMINENPTWHKPYFEHAKIFARKKLWSEAIYYINEAIQLNESEPMLFFSRARWLIQSSRFKESYNDLTKVIDLEFKLNDTYYLESAYFFRALSSSYLGDYKKVVQDCDNVRDDFSLYILGQLHDKEKLLTIAGNSNVSME